MPVVFRALASILLCAAAAAGRVTISLDGQWDIEDGVSPAALPAAYTHRVPVPGLAHLATPPFPGVGLFDSRELIDNRIRKKQLPASARVTTVGVPRQDRNYFWYRTSFRPPARKQVAVLKVNKAQFGTAVWLNGKPAGEHLGCFTAGYFNLTPLINWDGGNELVIRVGAHPAVLPASVPAGTDFEKLKWTPGIYDSVSLSLSDNPVIETVQVAPRLASSAILVETRVRNYGPSPVAFTIAHRVVSWKERKPAGSGKPERLALAPGEEKVSRQTLAMPGARLWSPDDPFLYRLETTTGGDTLSTRFGMREFRFDTATRRAWLNGKVIFLRGSNITLHRFFEDPRSAALPWNEAWVRKLLVDIPRRMHWNSFRFCIGPAPDKWFDIADEAGLLIQHEYFIWTGRNQFHAEWTADSLIREYSEWVRDGWNHPSVAIWDACNETVAGVLGDKVIPAVRKLDLSNRPWENGYNLPQDPDDPVEDHPYLFNKVTPSGERFRMTGLETYFGQAVSGHPTAHASILNEYGWLWLNRDGSPTLLTEEIYNDLLGPRATPRQRFALYGYLLGGLTEFWRSRRYHAAVLHFVYLTCSFPGVFTSDHFRDIEKLELEPHFADYVGEAFKPLGVYIDFWKPELKGGATQTFTVSVINDTNTAAKGQLVLTLESSGGAGLSRQATAFEIPTMGQHTFSLDLAIPLVSGQCLLKAAATAAGPPTLSRRHVRISP